MQLYSAPFLLIMDAGVDYIGIATPFYCNDGNGRFLFQKRNGACRDESGSWGPGSGKLEFGATPEENVLREVREEYGCSGEIQEQLPPHSVIRMRGGRQTHWLSIPFFVKVNSSEVQNLELHKIAEIGWFRLDALPAPLHNGFAFTFAKYQDRFEKYRVPEPATDDAGRTAQTNDKKLPRGTRGS